MSGYAQLIAALSDAGNEDGEYNAGYHDGYKRAVEEAAELGDDADATIAELVECIDNALTGTTGLLYWSGVAQTLVCRVRERTAAR